ncbi:hypothetical protein GH714_036691 [Hevea brasiliensis]|uniref:Legume lectin domain-containing protein n=1 Tax=Hevea brasiliensis TaxID=3981 RepID=A0A6A6KKP7_HEVBR|nr:hypothetical protein GH714_036691 [Hevea brasiliensis]
MHFSQLIKCLLLLALLVSCLIEVGCLSFRYPSFETDNETDLIRHNSYIVLNAIQVTPDVSGGPITNLSGRAFYKEPFSYGAKASTQVGSEHLSIPPLYLILVLEPFLEEKSDYNSRIVCWVWELHRMGRLLDAADQKLNGEFAEEEMECLLILGLACCNPNPEQRPSMKTVLQVLTGEAPVPEVPAEMPAFVWPTMPAPVKESDCLSLEAN